MPHLARHVNLNIRFATNLADSRPESRNVGPAGFDARSSRATSTSVRRTHDPDSQSNNLQMRNKPLRLWVRVKQEVFGEWRESANSGSESAGQLKSSSCSVGMVD